ncbi:MAG: hypothetical protein ACRDIV_07995, partial [Ktedonobacteraceae bacterium]
METERRPRGSPLLKTGVASRFIVIVFPLPKSGWGLQGMQEPPSGGNVMQATQASPDTLDAGFAIALA